ncbi:hypothetical protein [Nonomuraea typhae]|uniref:hypothetical protein n=1 Tax=Nonomuraea typhae TaxID=2603600 RepID=UPI0012FB5503|nr:hypothetical protein [Nonomuraea typhae]
MAVEHLFMLIMGIVVAATVALVPLALALRGIRADEWPVLRRRLVVWRGFIVR